MEDSFIHKGLRQKLVDEIARKGITCNRVLEAINKVPRHFFMDSSFTKFAYSDKAFPIEAGQTISQPYTVAFQTQLLDIKTGEKILEIGTGSGYQTAVLLELGAKVYTIERQRQLYLRAQMVLGKMGYKPHFFHGDGFAGKPTYGPFDKILVTAGAPEIPSELLKQLKVGGIMVIPIGDTQKQVMISIVRESEKEFDKIEHGNFLFVPMLKGTEN